MGVSGSSKLNTIQSSFFFLNAFNIRNSGLKINRQQDLQALYGHGISNLYLIEVSMEKMP